jgi:hypothetical protein
MKHHGLVPERRTNKNGVITTRWVKPDPVPKAASEKMMKSFMPLVGGGRTPESDRMDRMFKSILPAKYLSSGREKALWNIGFLDETTPDLLERIAAACDGGGEQQQKWIRLLETVDYASVEDLHPGITRSGIERALTVFPYIERLCGDSMDDWVVAEYMDHYYDLATFLTEESGQDEAPENETKAMVLTGFIRGITPNMSWEQAGMNSLYSEVKNDLEYLASHLEEVEVFLPELVKRKNFSREYIESVLTSDARSLSSGVL